MTVRQAAEKWNLSPRSVQQLCTQGRIPGAGKFGKAWAIPADAQKPAHPQQGEGSPSLKSPEPEDVCDSGMLMPLINTPFLPGRCLETAQAMAEGPQRDIALAEYHYFSGRPEQAALEVEPYLNSPHMRSQLSACLIYAYANLSLGRIQRAGFALRALDKALN